MTILFGFLVKAFLRNYDFWPRPWWPGSGADSLFIRYHRFITKRRFLALGLVPSSAGVAWRTNEGTIEGQVRSNHKTVIRQS